MKTFNNPSNKLSAYSHLTFAFGVSLNEDLDTFIPEGTTVEVLPYTQLREDSTKIRYNDEVIEYMNVSFVENNR